MVSGAVTRILTRLLRVEGVGWERLPRDGGFLVVCNHPARRDWLPVSLLAVTRMALALPAEDFPGPFWRFFLRLFAVLPRLIPIDLQRPESWEPLLAHMRGGGGALCFPEVVPQRAGRLGKVHDWPVRAALQAGVPLVPLHLEGSQRSRFLGGDAPGRRRWWPRLVMTVSPPWSPRMPEADFSPRERRSMFSRQLGLRMEEAALAGRALHRTLWEALIITNRAYPGGDCAISDGTGQALSRRSLRFRSLLLSALLHPHLPPAPAPVGFLLPTSVGGVVTLLALQFRGWLPVMLNFSAGAEPMLQALRMAHVHVVVTSRVFIAKAGLAPILERLGTTCRILYLEDLRRHVGTGAMLQALLTTLAPLWVHRRVTPWIQMEHPALLMLTSGSEGVPKGVLLSHLNVLANCAQVRTRLDFDAQDTLLNVLPLFHAFGLTMGTLAPLLAGVTIHLLPSPLDYEGIPALARSMGATLLAGTDTFLNGYGRAAHPLDFASLRFVFCGAEPLRERTRNLWMDKFGIRILEGYGATEASPVLAVNAPFAHRVGSVGCLLPGLAYRLEPVPGLQHGGRLQVCGPNIMLGYLSADSAARGLVAGWYDTGDVVRVDAEGFVFIVGRVKRFAKVGGEMVSLAAVESLACQVWPEALHAAIAMPDPQKGEQVVLVTTQGNPQRASLLEHARHAGVGEIHLPRKILHLENMPLLGVGKIDYATLRNHIDAGPV
ncbi:MAG: AMP-binding protein [Magnetococcales bacterium]|nr:AMP-binding protein [Magnetococcales bacterium]